jgi:hypothetical protein
MPTTFEHKPSATDDGQEYEQRFAALNAKYFVEEDGMHKLHDRETKVINLIRRQETVATEQKNKTSYPRFF